MSFLETRALSRHFGGLTAVDRVDFRLDAGEIRAVIGPNGAGKTTLVSMICGRMPPSSGVILFGDADITRLAPWQRVARGIVYTFQITSVFRNLTCFENVALAAQRALTLGRSPWHPLDQDPLRHAVSDALRRVELHERHDTPAANLPYGHQRLLEVAMSLALKPKLLVLDEPTQGLSEAEISNFCRLVREIAQGPGVNATILLIEHNMDVVMELAQRITVMSNGAVLAEGTPAEITANAAVQQAYLGA
jgi:branched-chain amino acid transport system ATP-binding protein